MKRILAIFLILLLLLNCFTACIRTDADPNDSAEGESKSETETTSAESPKPVRFDQADIPGTRLEFELLYASPASGSHSDWESSGKVLNQSECQAVLNKADRSPDSVDLNTYRIIRTTACYGTADIKNDITAEGFGVNEVIMQEDRLVVVYESMYDVEPGGFTTGEINYHVSYILVKASDLPQGDFEFVICGYSSINQEYSCDYLNHYYE